MREILVISGKGGTGKTSVTAALATLFDNIVLADCDVDAADLHLVTNPDIKVTSDFISGRQASINQDNCTGCGKCFEVCRFDAVKTDSNGKPYIDPVACEGCGVCTWMCPQKCIDFPESLCGHLYSSDTRFGPMVHAKLSIAAENSGKLVSEVRSQAKLVAKENNIDTILIDGPPGIGCPVIASMTGVEYAIIVTEPSLSAIHDMERVIKLTQYFGIKVFICINKCDINKDLSQKVKEMLKGMKIDIIGEIPYDSGITAAQIEKKSVIEHGDSKAADEIVKMHQKLSKLINNKGQE